MGIMMGLGVGLFFFFSSRRRHTRSDRDWSSDVCSSDLVDLDALDVISFPVGVARRFMNVTYDEPGKEHLLMFIIGGNQPQAEFTPLAMQRCEQFSREQQRQTASRRPAPPRRPASTAAKGGPARSARQRKPERRAGR